LKKVLVIRFSSLGDVILASCVLQPLYEKGYKIDFLTFKPFDQLFVHDFRVRKVISLEKKHLKSLKDIKNFAENLNYDIILDLHSNLRTKLLSVFSSKAFIRYEKKSLKRRLLTIPFFKRFIDLSDFNVLKAYQEPLRKIGIENKNIYKPRIILTKEELKNAKAFLPEGRFITIGAGARYKNKMYPFFDKVAQLYQEKGFKVILIGSKEDKEKDKTVFPAEVIDLRGRLSLRESLAVISISRLTISNDSGVAHMARSVSTPVFMVYGATHPYFGFYPLEEEGDFIYKNLPCQPCDLHGKKPCKYEKPKCLYSINPEEIFNKSLKLVKKNGV
jgi:ADP-heptose:LPS heptosyltransferase